MGKFDKYTGKVTLHVDGEDWIIRPTNREVAKFLAMDGDKIKTEAGFVNMTDALISMFVTSYPSEPKDNISAFVLANMDVIMSELVVKMGWATEADLKKAITDSTGKLSQEAEKKGSV